MRLGRLIERLRRFSPQARLEFEAIGDDVEGLGAHPSTDFHSYRGYYERLAFGNGHEPTTVGAFLSSAKACVGGLFTGYKGGEFRMGEHTPVHVANWGETSDNRIVGVRGGVSPDYVVFLQVANVEDW